MIAIFRLLVQKESFKPVDFELFELLGGHAATALYVSRLLNIPMSHCSACPVKVVSVVPAAS